MSFAEPELVAQHKRPCDVEEVVARDTDVQVTASRGSQCPFEHALVVRVDVGLGVVRRRGPPHQLGVDVLHREVRALHDADAYGRAAGGAARGGPFAQLVQHGVRVGEVGLQRDAAGQ